MLPFIIDQSGSRDTIPVTFKEDDESKKELNKKRTKDELVDIIKGNGLQSLVSTAMFNNDLGFSHIPLPGRIEKRKDDYYIIVKGLEPIKADVSSKELFKEVMETFSADRISVLLYTINDNNKIFVMVFDSKKEKEKFWNDPKQRSMPAISLFLESTGIDTLKGLGDAINQGAEIFAGRLRYISWTKCK